MRIFLRDLGTMEYKACWDLQRRLFEALLACKAGGGRTDEGPTRLVGNEATTGARSLMPRRMELTRRVGNGPDEVSVPRNGASVGQATDQAGTILMVEHEPVYTLGKSGCAENLLIDREALKAMGARFFHIDRGGDITFHGPGQLVCYPILDLEALGMGLRAYIEAIEEAVIRTVARYGIAAGRVAGASGVWVGAEGTTGGRTDIRPDADRMAGRMPDAEGPKGAKSTFPRKICAIGVRSSRYVTMHGFALNVSTDLSWFARINPCGFTDRGVTSIERETGRKVPMDDVKELVMQFLSELLNVKIYK